MLLMAAMLCSTDSVAALAMIKYKDHPTLFSILFGEGKKYLSL